LVLSVETSVLSYIGAQVAGTFAQNFLDGELRIGCSNLVASAVSGNGQVRGVLLTCPNGPAFAISPPWDIGRDIPFLYAAPFFSPPPGLLGLYLFDYTAPACPTAIQYRPLFVNMTQGLGGTAGSQFFNSCAIVNSTAGTIGGFNIKWLLTHGAISFSPPSFMLSSHNTTVMAGQNATVVLTATSLHGFNGTVIFNVSVSQPSPSMYFIPTFLFRPQSVVLNAPGSNQTLVTIKVPRGSTPGNYTLHFIADPVNDLVHYGDFSASTIYPRAKSDSYILVT